MPPRSDQAPALIVQLVPPGEGGVRDYMACLAEQWTAAGVACQVIELSQPNTHEQGLAARLKALAPPHAGHVALVLHFSGYGFAPRGLCGWLVDELVQTRRQFGDGLRLAVVFHELFARGEPPWRSAFWLSLLQAAVAKRLARLADVVWTNTEHHAAWLHGALGAGSAVHTWPVFSNVGEPREVRVQTARAPQAIVFGSLATRRRALNGLKRCAMPLLVRLGIEELIEVGPGGPALVGAAPDGLVHRCAGSLTKAEVGRLLGASRLGLIEYPSNLLGKSGVFAAYAAHGCLVVNAHARTAAADGLVPGKHYAAPGHHAAPHAAERLHAWYLAHPAARQAEVLGRLLAAPH
jgi:hypothetical protein